jgi:hypothetical protein
MKKKIMVAAMAAAWMVLRVTAYPSCHAVVVVLKMKMRKSRTTTMRTKRTVPTAQTIDLRFFLLDASVGLVDIPSALHRPWHWPSRPEQQHWTARRTTTTAVAVTTASAKKKPSME